MIHPTIMGTGSRYEINKQKTLEGKYDDKNKYDGIDEFGEAKMEEQ